MQPCVPEHQRTTKTLIGVMGQLGGPTGARSETAPEISKSLTDQRFPCSTVGGSVYTAWVFLRSLEVRRIRRDDANQPQPWRIVQDCRELRTTA